MLDFAFESMNTYGIEKLKEMVENNESEITNSTLLNQTTEEVVDTNSAEENTAVEDVNSVEE